MKRLFRKYFAPAENGHMSESVFMVRIVLSFVMIMVSILALCAVTYAHYVSSLEVNGGKVISGHYFLQVTVNGESYPADVPVALEEGSYTVTVTKQGTATRGFCAILAEGIDKPIVSCQIVDDVAGSGLHLNSITFTLVLDCDTKVTFEGHWGRSENYPDYAYRGENNEFYYESNSVVDLGALRQLTIQQGQSDPSLSPPEPADVQRQHIVKSGETLSSIAKLYGVTWQMIAEANRIKDPNLLASGQVLIIPD